MAILALIGLLTGAAVVVALPWWLGNEAHTPAWLVLISAIVNGPHKLSQKLAIIGRARSFWGTLGASFMLTVPPMALGVVILLVPYAIGAWMRAS